MNGSGDGPHATVVLVASGQRRLVAVLDRSVPCDLDLVDRLLWLRLHAQRLGWCLCLEDIDDDLADLLDLAGVATWLTPPTDPSEPWPWSDRR